MAKFRNPADAQLKPLIEQTPDGPVEIKELTREVVQELLADHFAIKLWRGPDGTFDVDTSTPEWKKTFFERLERRREARAKALGEPVKHVGSLDIQIFDSMIRTQGGLFKVLDRWDVVGPPVQRVEVDDKRKTIVDVFETIMQLKKEKAERLAAEKARAIAGAVTVEVVKSGEERLADAGPEREDGGRVDCGPGAVHPGPLRDSASNA